MKKFKNYDEVKAYREKERLPRGAYILKIMNVEEVTNSYGESLVFSFDIAEGEHKGFYQQEYNNQFQEDKKWKGIYRLFEPRDDGSEKDAWTKSRFKSVMEAFEASNPGYHFDWDEKKLIGKTIGGLFINKEWEGDNGTGWFTSCEKFIDVTSIRNEKYTMPADKPLKKNTDFVKQDFAQMADDDEDADLPWN